METGKLAEIPQTQALVENKGLDDSLRVQKTEHIRQQLERQHTAEKARLEYLLKEQEVIERLRESIDESRWQTEGIRKYNREFQEHINRQIYEAHGITEDKLTGMKECKKALYRGAAAALFALSLVLAVLCGALYGFQSDVCLLMFAYMAMEGALLSGEEKRPPVLEMICRIVYMLVFPTMLVMFVCFGLGYRAYGLFLPYAVILGVFVTVVGMVPNFLYNPYRQDKKKILDAKKHIRDIERAAGKEVRKEQKNREKEERHSRKLLKRRQKTGLDIPDAAKDGREKQLPEEKLPSGESSGSQTD